MSLNTEHQQAPGLIFLIGFMGCGKTTWARKLSAKLGCELIDLDTVLETKAQMSIPEYFTLHGEQQFRLLESEVLKNTPYPANAIISTGGGLPCFFDHMEWMNSRGRSMYIKLSAKTLGARLENAKTVRPVLAGKTGDELIAFIEGKLAEREMFYNQATFIIDGIDMTVERLEEMMRG